MGIASRILQETTKKGLAKKILSDSAKKLLRAKLFGAPLDALKRFGFNRTMLNPGRLGETFLGDLLGVETRVVPKRRVMTQAAKAEVQAQPEITHEYINARGNRQSDLIQKKVDYQAPVEAKWEDKAIANVQPWDMERNSVGNVGTLMGYLGAGGVGTGIYAGYKSLTGNKDQPTAEGVDHPVVNEEEQALRDSFAKKNLGGSDAFTPEMYNNMTKNSWVRKAIKAVGTERYKKLREKGDAALIHRTLVSAIHADPELLKQAGSGDYALPGIYTDDTGPNVQVIHLNKGDKGYKPKLLNHMYTPPEAE